MLEFDHVIMVARDLEAAAARLFEVHGLASVDGGRHTGTGTGNRIVPLGGSYLEIMGILDSVAAGRSVLGRWVSRHTTEGDRLVAVCLRTDRLDELGARLGESPVPMSRTRPDGVVHQWRMVGLEGTLEDPGRPFFIAWEGPAALHPGATAVSRPEPTSGIGWVEIGSEPDTIESLLAPDSLDIRCVSGPRGVAAVGIVTASGEIVVRS